MSTEETPSKKKKKSSKTPKKLKKPKKNQENSYLRVENLDGDADVEQGISQDPETAVPYPEANKATFTPKPVPPEVPFPELLDDSPELTSGGNSLPNVPKYHKKPKGVRKAASRVVNQSVEKTAKWCSLEKCCCIFLIFIVFFLMILAGVTYEDHKILKPYGDNEFGEYYNDHGDYPGNSGGQLEYTDNQKNIILKLREVSGPIISTPKTAHHNAAHWMIWEDKRGLGASSPFLLQRYALALMFFQMEDGKECFSLDAKKNECDWDKVGCDGDGFVQYIDFESCNMSGSFPSRELSVFHELEFLSLKDNNLSGGLTGEISVLVKLKEMLLDGNNFSGSVPPQICSLHDKGSLRVFNTDCAIGKLSCACCTNCPNDLPDPDLSQDSLGEDLLDITQKQILKNLRQLSGDYVVNKEGTAQHKATHWILKSDELNLYGDISRLYQRYVIAILYYMMPDDKKCFEIESDVEECQFKSNEMDTGITWERISCSAENKVNYLKLDKCDLVGNIPKELKALDELDYLDMSNNQLFGEIPSELKDLKHLVHLYLDKNLLEGSMPSEICEMRVGGDLLSLTSDCTVDSDKVDCSCCTNCAIGSNGDGEVLIGLDSRQLAILEKLKSVSGNLVGVENTPQHRAAHFIMKQDDMMLNADSPLLFQRYVLSLLAELSSNNCFERSSGESECQWMSTGVDGIMWDRIACNKYGLVEYLKLDNCGMDGTIPDELKFLPELNYLDLSNNSFDGKVPDSLANLNKLGHLYLEKNSLIGSVPANVCALRNSGQLLKFNTDCTPDNQKVLCSCCTNCVDNTNNAGSGSRSALLMDKLQLLSRTAVKTNDTVQNKAAKWIINDDKSMLTASSKHLYQRYVLAIFYFMMGDQRWFSLDPLKYECEWEHVKCDDEGRVVEIKFDHSDMHGSIPNEISVLTELEILDLSHNSLDGGFIDALGDLTKLESLHLEGNNIAGSVPQKLCEHENTGVLEHIVVDCNQFVVCSCCQCNDDDLGNTNEATRKENIKTEINLLSNGAELDPSTPQHLAMNWILDEDKEHLFISSPYFAQRYTVAVIFFALGGEDWVNSFWLSPEKSECSIPGIYCNSANRITELNFSGEGMQGELPPEIKYLFELTRIDFSNNNIEGSVPDEWSFLKNLVYLNLQQTKLSGSIPASICSLRSNSLLSFQVDCNEVQCSCCTNCEGAQKLNDVESVVQSISFRNYNVAGHEKQIRAQAMDWVQHVDTLDIPVKSRRFADRYALVVFYYSTNGIYWTDGQNTWLHATKNHCTWKGVTCNDSGGVISLSLPSNNLSGDIPYELGAMEELQRIDLHSNKISGSLPNELGDLEDLLSVKLYSNQLQGPIPYNSGLCPLRDSYELTELWVDCDLDCPAGCCTKCSEGGKGSDTSNSDSKKTEIAKISYKQSTGIENQVRLSAQQWIQNIDESASTHQVEERYILSVFYYATNIGGQWKNANDWLNPKLNHCSWYGITCDTKGNVMAIRLPSNNLSGTIPYELGQMSNLRQIDLHSNKLTGTIPQELGDIDVLNSIIIFSNNMVGTLTDNSGVCSLRYDAELLELWVDCGIQCPESCCTKCTETSTSGNHSQDKIRSELIKNRVNSISSKVLSDDIQSARSDALYWMTNDDTTNLDVDSDEFRDRYILVLFYFYQTSMWTNGEETWTTRNKHHCYWYGIVCDANKNVVSVELPSNNLSGEIPYEFGQMSHLKKINLSSNNIGGTLPTEVLNLNSLTSLQLYSNHIQGSVLDSSAVCTQSADIWLDCNIGCPVDCCSKCGKNGSPVTGGETLPSTTSAKIQGKISEISFKSSSGNENTVRSTAANWIKQTDSHFFNVESVQFQERYALVVFFYAMGGDNWKNTADKWIDPSAHHCFWYGIVCDSEENVISLSLSNNNLSGKMPYELASIKKLRQVDLSSNNISGKIPDELQSLELLSSFIVFSNNLEGPFDINNSLCRLRGDGTLRLVWPDCSLQCPVSCCSKCDKNPATANNSMSTKSFEVVNKIQNISVKNPDDSTEQEIRKSALYWILNSDKLEMDISSTQFDERYILSVFYYSLNGSEWYVQDSTWMSSSHQCAWKGITCDTSLNVIAINLPSNNLNGQLPYELGDLKSLHEIDVHENKISGSIPSELGKIDSLHSLILFENDIQGSIDSDSALCEQSLRDFWVDCAVQCPAGCCTKCGLAGVTPNSNSSTSSTQIKKERMSSVSNKISSGGEQDARDLASSWMLYADNFYLSPDSTQFLERYILSALFFAMDGPEWSNSYASWMESDKHHCEWSGVKCDTDMFVTNINLASKNLHGTLPYELGNLSSLRVMDVHSNQIVGGIPQEMNKLNALVSLVIYDNDLQVGLTGQQDICDLRYMYELLELWVDCYVTCPSGCCTKCGTNGVPLK